MAKADMIKLKHPGSPDSEPFVTTPKAYEAVWKDKGWVLAENFEVVVVEDEVVEDLQEDGEAGNW